VSVFATEMQALIDRLKKRIEAMRMRLFMVILLLCSGEIAIGGLAHDMVITLQPDSGRLIVTDRIGFDEPREEFLFRLNAGLKVDFDQGKAVKLGSEAGHALYRLSFERPVQDISLRYQGKPAFPRGTGHGGMPQGDISPSGVYLDGSSAWYPLNTEPVTSLRLQVNEPSAWKVLSVGRRVEGEGLVTWRSSQPHDDLYLVAGPYTRHAESHGDIDLSVWLLQDDPQLAARYLSLMGEYIDHYSELIGDYPFAKFAVVENRWPTGLGMPSFTLLGSQVMRLPFIPYTSLPHEILHNWWGNGVWVDYRKGNWSEGLTAYLADHWMKERRGKGAEYRLRALQRYSNYAARGDDMPLLDFVTRHNEDTQSVGYSKSLMFFHMLRRALGDGAFEAGLRRLWQQHQFERIGFRQALQAIVGDRRDIEQRFLSWLEREGAPGLELKDVALSNAGGTHQLEFGLAQNATAPFDLDVPVSIDLSDGEALQLVQHLNEREKGFSIPFDVKPSRLRIDPGYDVLRYLDPGEQPPVLSQLFGGRTWLVLPTRVPSAERTAWLRLASAWQRRYPNLKTIDDNDVAEIPSSDNRLLLGWGNRALQPSKLSDRRFVLEPEALVTDGRRWRREDSAVVRVNTDADGITTGFVGAEEVSLIGALARKLTHYGAYGVLVFDAASATNRFKAVPDNPWSGLSRDL